MDARMQGPNTTAPGRGKLQAPLGDGGGQRQACRARAGTVGVRRGAMVVGVVAGAAMLAPATLGAAANASHHHIRPFGVVVDWRGASHTATVARPSGQLFAIHSNARVAVGSVVIVRRLTKLRNGTYSGSIVRVGHTSLARVRGRVVANLGRRGFALGATGTTFVVHVGRHAAGRFNSAISTPGVGSEIVADVRITGGGALSEIDVRDQCGCAVPGTVEIGGTLAAIDLTSHTIVITDDNDGNPVSYTVQMPASVDLTTLTIGQEIHLLATPNPDGTYTFAVAPTPLEIEGTISAIDTTLRTLTITNTDGGVTVTFVVDIPSTLNITGLNVGDEVQLEVVQNADGTYSLAQCSDNSDGEHANSQSGDQGGSGFGLWSGGGSSDGVARR